jgi:hypothetical protein
MLIPKLIHQIWLGADAPHPLMMEWRRRWRELHPGWELVVWRELGEGPDLHLVGSSLGRHVTPVNIISALLSRAANLAQRANIWRYLVLREYGGLYVDHDVEPVQPVDSLLEDLTTFTARRSSVPYVMCENAFMGAVPDHPWLADLVTQLPTRDPTVSLSMGCDYLTAVTRRHPEVSVLPTDQVVFDPPADWTLAKQEAVVPNSSQVYPPWVVAYHHWASLWHKLGFVALHAVLSDRPAPPRLDPATSHLPELRAIARSAGTPTGLRVLEWGSGLSTAVLADEVASRGSGVVLTIDHHSTYQQDVLRSLANRHVVHAVAKELDGPLTPDSFPSAAESNYGTCALEVAGPWDLIVVDGRRRAECCLVASLVASEDTIVALHDYRRFRYQPIRSILDVVRTGEEYLVMKKRRPHVLP